MGKKLILVGVGHVFDISEQIRGIISTVNPDAVALELDEDRFYFLLNPSSGKKSPNILYLLLSKVQDKIARKYGVSTGSEMVAAAEGAEDVGANILCIDKSAKDVIEKLWISIPLKRKILLMLGTLSSIFISRKKVEKELQYFEEEPSYYFEQIDSSFPEFKKVLIDERNEFMCNMLKSYFRNYDVIIAFVGEGHIIGMQKIIEEENEITLITIHLKDLRENNWKKLM